MAALLDPVLERHPDDPDALYARCTARAHLGQWEGARADVDRLIAASPRHVRARLLRASLELQRGEGHEQEALPDLDRALELEPGNLDGLVVRGVCRARLGRHREAIADLREYLRLAPPDHWRRPAAESSLGHLERLPQGE
jgi:regulator of sirC expression with transglutaminase-like and TPR domain